MTRRVALTTAQRVQLVRTGRTQAEAAQLLGVSVRTIRRWEREGVTPKDDSKLRQASNNARRRLMRSKGAGRVPALPVPPVTQRQKRIDPRDPRSSTDPKNARRINADTVSHTVRGWSVEQIAQLLRWYAERNGQIRLVYRVPAGGTEYKNGGRVLSKATNSGTTWKLLYPDDSAGALASWIEWLRIGDTDQTRILYVIAVQRVQNGRIYYHPQITQHGDKKPKKRK